MLSYLYFVDKKAEAQGGSLETCAGFEPTQSGPRMQKHCTTLPLWVPPGLPPHTHTHTHTLTPFPGPALQLSHFAQRGTERPREARCQLLGHWPRLPPSQASWKQVSARGHGAPCQRGWGPRSPVSMALKYFLGNEEEEMTKS